MNEILTTVQIFSLTEDIPTIISIGIVNGIFFAAMPWLLGMVIVAFKKIITSI
ncbi:hypothetical protein [Blautia marasmi]|uniref:hypothetical protein n=1 Tax=Blautia marasmi TaxID=1917868 RepID=UPI00131A2B2F|nr:hypothetical protein [Blautia marasmi]